MLQHYYLLYIYYILNSVFLGVATYKPADPAYASAGILVRGRLNFTASST